ncbi:venom acid phosphatase Acph-1-like isoform X2 [Venturia canescens]|nr:venom acid phosphatase Acph-1-like isoform X2 [Venturia canescens]
MTALLVAAGLFAPDNSSQKWNPTLNWQPVAISSTWYPHNILFFGCFLCSKYALLLEKTKLNDPEIVMYDARMKTLYNYVSRHIGKPVNNRILYYYYMELLATMSAGLPAPQWAEEIYLNGSLKEATIKEYEFSSWTDELKRLTGGVWLENWLSLVDDYVSSKMANESSKTKDNEEKKQAFFYSGHDINVGGIMNTLGIFYPHVPNYASAINLELHENEEHQFYVKVAHRDSEGFSERIIPGCDELLCPLDTFKNLFSKFRAFNATEECGSLAMLPGGVKSM